MSCNQPGRTGAPDEPKPKRPARREDSPNPQRPALPGDKANPQRPTRREDKQPRRALPAVPQPAFPAAALLATALGVLSGLRRTEPRLMISATDAEHLVPGVAAWLERDLTPEDVHNALTAGLPAEPLYRPAALLAHRPAPAPAALPHPREPGRPPPPPELRHLRPRLPRPRTRHLRRLPNLTDLRPHTPRNPMVNPPHEAMHHIFRHDLHLFSRLKDVLDLPLPDAVDAVVLPNDLTETRPVERRVDTLLRLDSAKDGALLLAIEAQGKKDPSKPASWAYYVSYLWTKYGLPTALLVVCQDRATAEWAARPVASGPAYMPTLRVQPIVVGPHNMPVITDPAQAAEDLALATLSAITHAGDPDIGAILKALSTALRDVPENVADPIIEFTAQG